MDKVSVIIPTYNRFHFLMNCLNSIKSQTYKNIEIIVINDKSTENEYYNYDWKGNDIQIIHLEKNTKKIFRYPCVGYVRNEGINIAQGKYIAFCDDDDIWFPNKLELQIKAMKESGCKMSCTDGLIGDGEYNIDKIYNKYNFEYYHDLLKKNIYDRSSDCEYEGEESEENDLLKTKFPKIWDLNFMKLHNCIACSSVVIEKLILDKINGFKNMKPPGEDYDCWLRVLEQTDSIYISEPCFYYDNNHGYGKQY